jgi:phosphoadenosine phosphosulfate reductase
MRLDPQIELMPLDFHVQRSVALLQANVPTDGSPYYGCFSGGKDSVCIKELARLAGVPVKWHYNVIIDPPELTRFIKEHHPDVEWLHSKYGPFFRRMREKLVVPTRYRRWCCHEYKHSLGPKGCTYILGVRVAESRSRALRYVSCVTPAPAGRHEIYPIRLWSDRNVWDFIRSRGLPYCSLYDEGFARLGCVGCPMTSAEQRRMEFDRWPYYKRQWSESLRFVLDERARQGRKPMGEAFLSDFRKSGLLEPAP